MGSRIPWKLEGTYFIKQFSLNFTVQGAKTFIRKEMNFGVELREESLGNPG